ncbi:DNA topoisomerase [Pseudosulfitobacter pseudonitzschiae]|uniref:DNA topoisomerase n=1 Tax=Pseudosulfitobacter pseudonitzschiae TaxID=1402135 RepID=UPI003B75E731
MPESVIICEKASQAKAIKAAVGSRYGVVLPARGHILTLKEPDEVREDWKTWSSELLWPGKFYPKKPSPDTRALLAAIKAAADGADRIIIATDCDREGQLIGGEIVDYLRFSGKVYRAMFNAEDPKSLQKAFANLEPNEKFQGLYMAGQAREQADQTTNLSLTRAATVTLRTPGAKGAIGIGRVKTPVLGIVCKRELEIRNFKPQDMFEIDADTSVENGRFILTCSKLPGSLIKEQEIDPDDEDDELQDGEDALAAAESMKGRILDRRLADGLKGAAAGHSGPLSAKFEKKHQGPPKLFDLTAMQAACSARFGWTGDHTLDVAQSLYAAPYHILTYPRAEAQHVPENNIADVPAIVGALMGTSDFRKHAALVAKPQVRRGKSGHFCDKALEGMSHYAIIPNVNSADSFSTVYPRLNADQKNLFNMVSRQYLAALAPDFEYRQTTVEMSVPWKGHDWTFRNTGRVPLVLGWKEILGGGGQGQENDFPQMKNGETAKIDDVNIRTVTTKPPARYTEGSLIKVMKECWRLVEDPAKRARLKEAKGIGTSATRGEVVKGLFAQGQLARKGKQVLPSEGGLQLYDVLIQACPNVVDPARTAAWEMLFDSVEKGRMTAEDAVDKILKLTQKEINNIKGSDVRIEIGTASKPTPKMIAAAKKIAERKGIKLPAGTISNSGKCRTFLEEHLGNRPKNADGTDAPFPPSEKQMEMARSLADRMGSKIPEESLKSSKDLSGWIDQAMKKAPPRAPSEKQLAFAERLSDEAGVAIPVSALKSSKELSSWMDDTMGKAPARPPSEKQIGFAKKIAEEKGIDLPESVEADMKECSAFIDQHTGGKKKTSNRRSSEPSY